MYNIEDLIGKPYKELIHLYLNEDKLETYLKLFYPNNLFIRNKAFPGNKFRPDFRCDILKIIIEFDGLRHYTEPKTILKDSQKDIICKEKGYSTIRIPYFIQLNTEIIKLLFQIDYNFEQIFPHGFICEETILPASFCEIGIDKLKSDLKKFNMCYNEISNNLTLRKTILQENILEIIPPSLMFMIKEF